MNLSQIAKKPQKVAYGKKEKMAGVKTRNFEY